MLLLRATISEDVMPVWLSILVLQLHFISGQVGAAVALLLVCTFEGTLLVLPTASVRFTPCGARTRNHRREADLLVVVVVVVL